MARQYKVFSGDGHIDLNPDVWRNRVAAKWRDRAPKRVKMPNGSDAVVVDGGKPNTIGVTRSVRVAHKDLAKQVPTFENSAGTGSPEQRLREQDQDGIEAEILFSQISFVLRQAKDDDLYLELVRAYNEFLAEEYMAVAPDRLICMGTIPVTGVEDAVRALEHCAKLGLRGVKLDSFPGLEMYWAETMIGWFEYGLWQIDDHYKRYMPMIHENWGLRYLERKPSEYLKERTYWGFLHDPVGIRRRDCIGYDKLMWGTDFAHAASEWPNSIKLMEQDFADVPENEKRAM